MARTTKQMKEYGLELIGKGVKCRGAFREGIPFVVELRERIGLLRASVKELQNILTPLNEMVCDYADANPKAFDMIRQVKDEADESIIVIDGVTYVYKRGWNGLTRISGNNKTSEFLLGLPEEWVRSYKEIDVSEINRLGVPEAELQKYDLEWCAKRTWSKEANE